MRCTTILMTAAAAAFGIVPLLGQTPLPSSFLTCIATAGTPSAINFCPLAAGTYAVPSTLNAANYVYIYGTGSSYFSTTLKRTGTVQFGPTPSVTSMLTINSTTWLYNLTFDGNRGGLYSNPQPGPTMAGQGGGPGSGWGCVQANLGSHDVDVNGVAYINNVGFLNAPDASLWLAGGSVQNSFFQGARSTAIFLYGNGSAYYNSIYFAGTAAINVYGQGGSQVVGNTLYENRLEMPDEQGGGQLFTDPSSANATLAENIINGANWQTPISTSWSPFTINGCWPPATVQYSGGVEAYSKIPGGNHKFYNNEITQHLGGGMGLGGSDGTYISGYDYAYSSTGPKYFENNGYSGGSTLLAGVRGISIYPTSCCGYNTNITLDHIRSINNSGDGINVYASYGADNTAGTGYINSACLSTAGAGYNPYFPIGGFTPPWPFAAGGNPPSSGSAPVSISSCP